MLKKPLVVTVAIGMALSLAACSTGNTNNDSGATPAASALPTGAQPPIDTTRKVTDGTSTYPKITVGISQDPQDLNPFDVNGGSKPYIMYEIYEPLFDLNGDQYTPHLAKSYTEVDATHYDVTIWNDIYDSAGNHITADDVLYSFQQKVASGMNFKWDMVGNITKVDDYTVEFTWNAPITQVGELEFPWCRTMIFSQKAFESGNFATNPVGTGPYVVSSFTSGSSVVLKRNPNYWQKDVASQNDWQKANVDEIDYQVIAEPAQQVLALQNGSIDYSDAIPQENLADFQAGGQYASGHNVWLTAGSLLYLLTPNCSSGSPTSDQKLRQAIFYAIDNASVAQATGNTIAATGFGTPFFSDYVAAWDTTPSYQNQYDPDQAKTLVGQSTYSGQTLTLLAGDDATSKSMATIIQSFLVNVGIKVTISTVDGTTLSNDASAQGTWDLYLNTVGGGSQVGEWNRALSNTEYGNGMALGFIQDAQLQSLFETANDESTHTPENMTAVANYVISNAYNYAVAYPLLAVVYNSKIAHLYMREDQYFLPGASTYYLD